MMERCTQKWRNKEEQPTKPASNFLTTPKEAEPDRENLSNFGKMLIKSSRQSLWFQKAKSIKTTLSQKAEDGFASLVAIKI